ncbi:MAG: biotin transporter BioY [Candidatus Heimdallarchaeaceae archaeon]
MKYNERTWKYQTLWKNFQCWKNNTSVKNKLLFSSLIAIFTGISAQIRIYLPWTPVPITLQTYVVMIAPILLGTIFGGISQILYIMGGIAGIPWFAGWKGGIVCLVGPTGGYLIGFVATSFFIGYIRERCQWLKNKFFFLILLIIANVFLIYLPGLTWLWLWYNFSAQQITFIDLLAKGVLPFLPGDITKILLVITTKEIIKQ